MIKSELSFLRTRVVYGSFSVLGLLALIAIFNLAGTCYSGPPYEPSGTGGEVHGFVFAAVQGQESSTEFKARKIFLPDITVYLKNVSTSALSPKVATNERGWFAIPHMPAGTYQLCWDAEGYISGYSIGSEDRNQ